MPRTRDITGEKFGRLTAKSYVGSRYVGKQPKRFWSCECDCGQVVERSQGALTTGNTRSCGCLLKEAITIHGMAGSPIYSVWHAMILRCRDVGDPSYKDYGGRGITVCERWKEFANFTADMGERPENGTLERNEVNGNYEKSNCRWATQREQANNRRNNHRLEFAGKTLTIAEWSRETGLTKGVILHRINAGWSINRILTSPSDRAYNNTKSRLLSQK